MDKRIAHNEYAIRTIKLPLKRLCVTILSTIQWIIHIGSCAFGSVRKTLTPPSCFQCVDKVFIRDIPLLFYWRKGCWYTEYAIRSVLLLLSRFPCNCDEYDTVSNSYREMWSIFCGILTVYSLGLLMMRVAKNNRRTLINLILSTNRLKPQRDIHDRGIESGMCRVGWLL